MSKHPKNKAKTGQVSIGSSPAKRAIWYVGIALVGLMAVLYIVFRTDFGIDHSKGTSAVIPGETGQNAGNATIDRLVGRWIRPDGGYILDIRDAGAGGRLDVGYYNPKPINIGRADWVEKDGKLYVMVELEDVNYPGSTYGLEYIVDEDRLVGTYYQAVEKSTFDVVFVKER